MQNLITNPKVIRIPNRTLILICGVQNSGKSHFCHNYFNTENTVCTDDLFLSTAKSISSVLVTPHSRDSFILLQKTTEDKLLKTIQNLANEKKYVVLDAIGLTVEKRLGTINAFQDYFDNIIQIVLMPSLVEIQKRGIKEVTLEKAKLGLRSPSILEISISYMELAYDIPNGKISEGTDTTYILTEIPKKFSIKFD